MRKDLEQLSALGQSVRVPMEYNPKVLDTFANAHEERDYWVTFTAPEFTTLCPKTPKQGSCSVISCETTYIPRFSGTRYPCSIHNLIFAFGLL